MEGSIRIRQMDLGGRITGKQRKGKGKKRTDLLLDFGDGMSQSEAESFFASESAFLCEWGDQLTDKKEWVQTKRFQPKTLVGKKM